MAYDRIKRNDQVEGRRVLFWEARIMIAGGVAFQNKSSDSCSWAKQDACSWISKERRWMGHTILNKSDSNIFQKSSLKPSNSEIDWKTVNTDEIVANPLLFCGGKSLTAPDISATWNCNPRHACHWPTVLGHGETLTGSSQEINKDYISKLISTIPIHSYDGQPFTDHLGPDMMVHKPKK